MESDKADGEVFLFTSESVGEGHPGEWCNILAGDAKFFVSNRIKSSNKLEEKNWINIKKKKLKEQFRSSN